MPRKTSIYVDANSEAILAARDGARSEIRRHGRRSLIFRELIRRYDDICRRADPPDLTEPEWNVLVQAGERWAEQTDIDAGVRWARLLAAPGRNERFLKKLLELGPAAQLPSSTTSNATGPPRVATRRCLPYPGALAPGNP